MQKVQRLNHKAPNANGTTSESQSPKCKRYNVWITKLQMQMVQRLNHKAPNANGTTSKSQSSKCKWYNV